MYTEDVGDIDRVIETGSANGFGVRTCENDRACPGIFGDCLVAIAAAATADVAMLGPKDFDGKGGDC